MKTVRLVQAMVLFAVSVGLLVAQTDTLPPQLLSLSISPGVVDVTSSARTVTVSLHVTDDLSGIDTTTSMKIVVGFVSPSRNQYAYGFVPSQPGGPLLDAVFSIPAYIPRFAEPGTWTISSVRLRDNVGNTVYLSTAALVAAGFPTTVAVLDSTPDTQPPQLTALSFTPSSVDVSGGPANITVDLAIRDDASGLYQWAYAGNDFVLSSPSGRQMRFLTFLPADFALLPGGSNINGIWRATLHMPQFSEPGIWKLTSLVLRDVAGSARYYDAAALAAFGSSIEVTVTSSPTDLTPPGLAGLTFTPSFINTSLGPQTVQVDMNTTDDLSGVSFASESRVLNYGRGTWFFSPSGAQSATAYSYGSQALFPASPPPTTGTRQNGTWRFNAVFPQFSEAGTWKAGVTLKDAVRNEMSYSNAQLVAGGFSSQLVVIQPSLTPDGSIGATGGIVADSVFGSRAELIVPPGVFSQSTSVAIDVLQSPIGIPLPSGFSSAETYFVNVQLTPTPVFPLPAPGITVVLPLRNYIIPGTELSLLRIDPGTGNLVPALNVSGNSAVGLVDPGGMKATFVGISRFSTIVGVLPNAITVEVDIKPGGTPNIINTNSQGTIPVAVFSTPTLDLTKVDPATIRLSGAPVASNKKGKFQVSIADVNGDGLEDIIVHFETESLFLGTADVQGVVEGRTLDGRMFRGTDSVKVIK